MKIAIPSATDEGLASMRSGHFGHTPFFTIVEYEDSGTITSGESVQNVDHDEAGCGGVIQYVLTLGVDGILTAGMGMRPLMGFTQNGVTVYSDTDTPNVGEVAQKFARGEVAQMSPDQACHH